MSRVFEQRAQRALSLLSECSSSPFALLCIELFCFELGQRGWITDAVESPAVWSEAITRWPDQLGEFWDPSELTKLPERHARQLRRELLRLREGLNERTQPDDIFGMLYMCCAGPSAQQARGEFYTPSSVATLLAETLDCEPLEWVLDPACGTGGLLLATLAHTRTRLGLHAASVTLIGIELNPLTAALARMNLVLAGAARQALVFSGNALSQRVAAYDDQGKLREICFNRVLANPPFGNSTELTFAPAEPLIVPARLARRSVPAPV